MYARAEDLEVLNRQLRDLGPDAFWNRTVRELDANGLPMQRRCGLLMLSCCEYCLTIFGMIERCSGTVAWG